MKARSSLRTVFALLPSIVHFSVTASACLGILAALSAPASAQWENVKSTGIPRTADGKLNLSAPAPRAPDGKPDLSGIWWMPNRGPANTGVPPKYLNNIAADLKAGGSASPALGGYAVQAAWGGPFQGLSLHALSAARCAADQLLFRSLEGHSKSRPRGDPL